MTIELLAPIPDDALLSYDNYWRVVAVISGQPHMILTAPQASHRAAWIALQELIDVRALTRNLTR